MIYRMYLRTFIITLGTALLTIVFSLIIYLLSWMRTSDFVTALIMGIVILLSSDYYFISIESRRQMIPVKAPWSMRRLTM